MNSVRALRVPVGEDDSRRANRRDWDRYADEYQASHGAFLGDAGFVWGPEGQSEADLGLLGVVTDRDVLELGSGAGQCSRWVNSQGGRAIGLDLSMRQLQHSRRLDDETGITVPQVCGTATQLPFAPDSFDIVFCSFGALQFVADAAAAVREAVRVMRPAARFVFSVTHPTRWMFQDDPGDEGLVASQSYWDRTPYVEVDDVTETVSYVEHHRTIGDWVALMAAEGLALIRFEEPEWPADHDRIWGGWSRTRGLLTPGTAIFVAQLMVPAEK